MQDLFRGLARSALLGIAALLAAAVVPVVATAQTTPAPAGARLDPGLLVQASWHGRPIRRPLPLRPTAAASDRTPLLQRGTGLHAAAGSTRVRALQGRLLRLGYRPGPADGRFGARTQAALVAFQRKHGLPQDGAADRSTLRTLRRRTTAPSPVDDATTPATSAPSAPQRPATPPTGRDLTPVAAPATDGAGSTLPLVLALLLGVPVLLLVGGAVRRRAATHAVAAEPAELPAQRRELPAPPMPWPTPAWAPDPVDEALRAAAHVPDDPAEDDGTPEVTERPDLEHSAHEPADPDPTPEDHHHDHDPSPRDDDRTPRFVRRLTPEQREELRERIDTLRASGMTLQAIADRLTAEGVPTLGGGARWRPRHVRTALEPARARPHSEQPSNVEDG